MSRRVLWFVALIVLFFGMALLIAGPGSKAQVVVARSKIKQGARVVDVRTPREYAAGHYAGALNIPLQELERRLSEVGPLTKPVVVYCRSGSRSASAKKILVKAGFKDVTDAGALESLQE